MRQLTKLANMALECFEMMTDVGIVSGCARYRVRVSPHFLRVLDESSRVTLDRTRVVTR